jgi:tagatose 1,6-diphosphate aldolase
MSYEKTGYDANVKGRMPDLLAEWSVRRLVEAGANAIKILLYINPFDQE